MTLSDVSIKRPVFTIMVSLAIVVLGLMGLFRLGVNLFPDIEFPIVTVTTIYPGASPAEIESQVTQHIEDAIVSVAGVKHISSFSRESTSFILIEFELDADPAESAALVRERVAGVRYLMPRDAEEPTVARFDANAVPIATYVLAGDYSEAELPRLRRRHPQARARDHRGRRQHRDRGGPRAAGERPSGSGSHPVARPDAAERGRAHPRSEPVGARR